MTARDLWEAVLTAPRTLASVSLAISTAFFAVVLADGTDSIVSLIRPLLGALLWSALGWYVAEHGESRAEQVMGTAALLLLIALFVPGLVYVLLDR